MADQCLEFARVLGVDPEPLDYGLRPSPDAVAWRDTTLGPEARYAVLVLASSALHKNWMPELWAEVAQHLVRDLGVPVVLAGATSVIERTTADAILRTVGDGVYDTLGSGIPRLLALLAGAALVVSPDTGPLHMAVALSRPVIGLYGSTNPKWVGPYRADPSWTVDRYGSPGEDYEASTARREGRMALITADEVIARVTARMATTV
jgi:heptosyltransferase I